MKYKGQKTSGVEMSFLNESLYRTGPMVWWLIYDDQGPFTRDEGKKAG